MTGVREIKALTIVFQVNKHLLIACYEHRPVLSARDAQMKNMPPPQVYTFCISELMHFRTNYDISQTRKC